MRTALEVADIFRRHGAAYRSAHDAHSERAISDLLVALSFSHISARPQHPKQDQRVIEAFKKTSPARSLPT